MKNVLSSNKRTQIDKAKTRSVSFVAIAVFVTVFSLVSANSLLKQRSYQAKVINKKEAANDQLEKNIEATESLVASYKQFVASPVNMISGNPSGTGEKDGDNARLVLDALPSKYDFPAVATSFEKILNDKKIKMEGITGTDDEIAQSSLSAETTPKAIDIPVSLSVEGSYSSMQDLINVFERSIRPFTIQKISLNGGTDKMKMNLELKTYFQPEKKLNIKMETVN